MLDLKGHVKSFELDDKYRKFLTLIPLEQLIVVQEHKNVNEMQ